MLGTWELLGGVGDALLSVPGLMYFQLSYDQGLSKQRRDSMPFILSS